MSRALPTIETVRKDAVAAYARGAAMSENPFSDPTHGLGFAWDSAYKQAHAETMQVLDITAFLKEMTP